MSEDSSGPTAADADRCGTGVRGLAMFVDSFAWFALMFVAFFSVAALTGDITTTGGETSADLDGLPGTVAFLLWLGLGVGYHALLEWQYGRTLGKHLAGIRVRNADGSPLSLRASVVRNVLRLVDWLPVLYIVGIILINLSDEKARLGDRVADTAVVQA